MTGVNMFNGFPESYSAKTLIGNAGWESRSIQIFHPDLHPNSTGYKVGTERTRSEMHDQMRDKPGPSGQVRIARMPQASIVS